MAKASSPAAELATDLHAVCDRLEKRYGQRKPTKYADFIEALVSQILEIGVKEGLAREVMRRLREEFVDWNDMRVATVREIEDVLGPRYYQVREKAEDIKLLLAALYTAFRKLDLSDKLDADGIATLRALPDTTNIRRDMVDRALLITLDLKVFPCDEDQFRLLKFLGGVPKPLSFQIGVKKVEEALDNESLLRLSRVLREHVHTYQSAGKEEPQPVDFGLSESKGTAKHDKPSTAKHDKPSTAKHDKPSTAKHDKPSTAKHDKPSTAKHDKAETKKPVKGK